VERAIHEVDPGHIVWYASGQHTYTGAPNHLGDRVNGPAGLSMHAYCLEALSVPRNGVSDAYCPNALERTLADAERHAEISGDALLLSEFGATQDPQYWALLTDMADRHLLPWTMWSYSELAGDWNIPGEPGPQPGHPDGGGQALPTADRRNAPRVRVRL